jgi:hypothetical protein
LTEYADVVFREVQTMRRWWIWLLTILIAVVPWWAFIQQIVYSKQFGDHPAPDFLIWIIFILFGIGLPWLLFSIKLITILRPNQLVINFFPLNSKKINLADIKFVEARQYHPLRDYGGFGIRWSPGKGMAYNTSGNTGVMVETNDGKKVLIGSQKADELVAAIKRMTASN